MVRLISLLVLSLFASVCAGAQAKYSPLPEKIKVSKTIYLENRTTYSDVFNHLYDPLSKWGRWKVVGEAADADLRLILTRTAASGKNRRINPWWFLVITAPNDEAPILYISLDIAISGSRGAANHLVKKLRERIEKAAQ